MTFGSLESCMQKGPNSKHEKVISYKSLSPFRDRHADVEAYRGNVCNQKGSPRVNWITGKLHAKNQGPKSRVEKGSAIKPHLDRHWGNFHGFSRANRFLDIWDGK